ncbi:methyltransferase domain-containing protein [Anaerolineales bacterium HSG24]|nr:methyltransferase domain-containing protein [Anaerolineales bacterium HSG24]
MIFWLTVLIILALTGLFLYWQLIIAEGAYLGARVVAFTYDCVAEKYNNIKEFEDKFEDFAIGVPIANRFHRQPKGMILDIATGTGRVPLALMRQTSYRGQIIGLDRASRMLSVAHRDTVTLDKRVILIQADAMALPFADNSFPMVTCLEALEFMPSPEQGLREMVRVLAPTTHRHPDQGWLFTSNRIGWEARLMPGKTWSTEQLRAILEKLPLRYIDITPWESIYDMVWAQKIANGE